MKINLRKIGDWHVALRTISRSIMKIDLGLDIALRREAVRVRAAIIKGLRSGSPGGQNLEPLSEKTIKLKGSSKELIATGRMLNSIKVTQLYPKVYLVGIPRSIPSHPRAMAKGLMEADLAAIHEFGAPNPATSAVSGSSSLGTKSFYFMTVSKAQAKFFRWAKKFKGIFPVPPKEGDLLMMNVPKRPFIGPVWDAMKEEAPRRIATDFFRFLFPMARYTTKVSS